MICDRVLGAQADRFCTCGYLLPSASPLHLNPYVHDETCRYRRHALGTALLRGETKDDDSISRERQPRTE